MFVPSNEYFSNAKYSLSEKTRSSSCYEDFNIVIELPDCNFQLDRDPFPYAAYGNGNGYDMICPYHERHG